MPLPLIASTLPAEIDAALAALDVEDFSVLPPLQEPLPCKGLVGLSHSHSHARPVLRRQRAVMSVADLEDTTTPMRPQRGYKRLYHRSSGGDFSTHTTRPFLLRTAPSSALDENSRENRGTEESTTCRRSLRWPY